MDHIISKYCPRIDFESYEDFCNGFAINSLNPGDPDYREDLHRDLTGAASYF